MSTAAPKRGVGSGLVASTVLIQINNGLTIVISVGNTSNQLAPIVCVSFVTIFPTLLLRYTPQPKLKLKLKHIDGSDRSVPLRNKEHNDVYLIKQ